MKAILHCWVPVALLVVLFAALLPAAEASPTCRISKGGSSTDALGEEYPELWSCPLLFGFEFIFVPPWVFVSEDGLGEEFPEKQVYSKNPDALGEEFPE